MTMAWDSEPFTPKNGVFRTESELNREKPENKSLRCAGCNELISVVSTTLYEIDNKHYCSECYSRKIVKLAVERDHNDLSQKGILAQR